MKVVIQDIRDLSDSRELLEASPHPFIAVFIYILIIIIVTAAIWSYFGKIDIVVKANGIVRPGDAISTIRNKVSGQVEAVYFTDGKRIKRGEILFIIEHSRLDIEKVELTRKLKQAKEEMKKLTTLRASIKEGKDLFSKRNGDEKDFYNRYQQYQINMEIITKEIELDKKRLNDAKDMLDKLNLLQRSMELNENLLSDVADPYYKEYTNFELKRQSLQMILKQKEYDYEINRKMFEAGAVTKNQMDCAKQALNQARLEYETFIGESIASVFNRIEETKKTINELEFQIRQASNNQYKYKIDTDIDLNNAIQLCETNIEELENKLKSTEVNINDCFVRSPIDGVINIITNISKGDILPSGTDIVTIVPIGNSPLRAQLYILNKDIANVKIGSRIKYHFMALPYKEYGELEGTIVHIGVDTRFDQQKLDGYYIAEATIDDDSISSFKGDQAQVKVGMLCEAQIITKSKRLLFYLLEKIALLR
ncbi:MAG: HlyD family efflux transporter periplasmic adaptor subunit [Firmicutes bacterium]|nr:HlyD family efflux transporter periplasmic adaptor subunit [Bacillota bacterium]